MFLKRRWDGSVEMKNSNWLGAKRFSEQQENYAGISNVPDLTLVSHVSLVFVRLRWWLWLCVFGVAMVCWLPLRIFELASKREPDIYIYEQHKGLLSINP